MSRTLISRLAIAASLAFAASGAMAVPVGIDTTDPTNGLYDIYSSTFDGAAPSCGACFFGVDPTAVVRHIGFSPNPTGVMNGTPGGIAGAGLGSSLDVTSNGTQVTLAGGTIRFSNFTLNINGALIGFGTAAVTTSGAGMVFDLAPQVATIVAGQADFLVNLSPATAVDFSTVGAVVTGCTPTPPGNLCTILGGFNLDMLKYRLLLSSSDNFATFTGTFEGQTSNNSILFANLNSVPVPAAGWLMASALGLLAGVRRRLAKA